MTASKTREQLGDTSWNNQQRPSQTNSDPLESSDSANRHTQFIAERHDHSGAASNGFPRAMSHRAPVSNDPQSNSEYVNGNESSTPPTNGSVSNSVSPRTSRNGAGRPASARRDGKSASSTDLRSRGFDERRHGSSQDDSETDREVRRPKPLFLRAKSDFGPRGDTPADGRSPERDMGEYGARHGFEDHYISEEYVSQLANVSWKFHLLRLFL